MTDFQYTDQQLNYLNRAQNVYSTNRGFAKRNKLKWVTENPENKNQKNIITTPDGQCFKVIKTRNDGPTGFDGMAVAPYVNGKPDLQNVAIIAAGTDPNHYIDSRDGVTAVIGKLFNLSPQYGVADKFTKTVMGMKDVRVTKLTGYSQGSYMLKIGAKYQISTTVFNGWFKYKSLSPEERNFIREHPDLFVNYRKKDDDVVVLNDGNNPSKYGNDFGTIKWISGSSHKIEDWVFDSKTGQLLDKKGGKPVVSLLAPVITASFLKMQHFSSLKSKWKKSGGKLSSSEKIFLDAVQGEILSTSMVEAAETGETEVSQLRDKANQEIEDIWSKIDFDSYTELTPFEVQTAFMNGGITYDKFVGDFQSYTNQVASKMKTLSSNFKDLSQQLRDTMNKMQEEDSRLAKEFEEWKEQM